MHSYIQAIGLVFVAVIMIIVLQKQGKETAVLLSILACCILGLLAVEFLSPVIEFFHTLVQLGNLDIGMLQTLLKIVGIAMLSEISGLICADAGSAALGKMLQLLASGLILWLSLPMLNTMLELIERILDNL